MKTRDSNGRKDTLRRMIVEAEECIEEVVVNTNRNDFAEQKKEIDGSFKREERL